VSPDRWPRVKALYDEALEIAPADREVWLETACEGDADLRTEVERLLAVSEQAGAFFETFGRAIHDDAELAMPLPERVGPWRVVREVGRGGMGQVLLAERDDGLFDQRVAVKLVHPGLGVSLLSRFRAERRILAGLDHPGIARLIDGGVSEDGRPYLVMEYVEGEPITRYADRKRLSIDDRLKLAVQVCEAVAFAHRHLVVHRDIKPSNVLVAETDNGPRVKLLDFGIAKLLDAEPGLTLTDAEGRVMTPEYAAPEQVRGEAVTTATDVYALGVLLYELLTGTRPYQLESRVRQAVELAILEATPTEPSTAVTGAAAEARAMEPTRLKRRLRGDLDQIVLKALRKSPDRRYEGAAALAADVGRHLEGLPVEARPESVGYRVGRFVRRHRVGVAAAAVTLLAIVGGAGVALWQAAEADRQRVRAEAEAQTSTRVTDLLMEVFNAGDPYRAQGDTLNAYEILDQGLPLVDSLHDEPEVQARLLHTLGTVYAGLGSYEQAIALLRRALSIPGELAEAAPEQHAQMLGSLGFALFKSGDNPSALATLQSARDGHEAAGMPDTIQYATVLNHLCFVQHELSDYEASEAACRRAIELDEAVGTSPNITVGRYTNLALALEGQGEFQGAADVLQRALAIQDGLAAPNLIERAFVEGSLARILASLGKTDEAEPIARMGLRRMQEVLDARHDNVAIMWVNLGRVHEAAGSYNEALAAYQTALDIQRETIGADHPLAITTLNNVGVTHARAGRLGRAVPLLREALERRRRVQGEDHAEVAVGLGNLAALEDRQGRTVESIPLYREAIERSAATFGAEHATTGQFQYNLGRAYITLGQPDSAEAVLQPALEIFESAFPSDHVLIAHAALELGRLRLGAEDRASALAHLQKALQIYEASEAPGVDESLAETRALLERVR